MSKYKIIIIFLFCLIAKNIFAQQYSVKYFSTRDGIPQSYINHIMVDSRGYYWVSTQGGVGCFNGIEWKNYAQIDGLPGSDITFSVEDKKGNIWIATNGYGVSKFDGKEFVNYDTKNGLNNNVIYSIYPDRKGNIWFASFGGLIKFDGINFKTYTVKDGLPTNELFVVTEDLLGNIWIGTRGYGLVKFDGVKFTVLTMKEGLTDDTIFTLFTSKNGDIWIGTASGGLCLWNGKKIEIKNNELIKTEFIGSIKEGKDGVIWIATDHQLVKYSPIENTYSVIKEDNGLSSNSILSLELAPDGSILIGTDNGFDVLSVNGPISFTEKDGLTSDKATTIIRDSFGNLLVGTSGGGINVISKSGIYNLNHIPQIANSKALCFFKDSKNNIWIGFDSWEFGAVMLKYVNGKYVFGKNINSINGKKFSTVTKIIEDKNGNIWISIFGTGIIIYDGKNSKHLNEENELQGNDILTMFKDSKENIWISVYNKGLIKYDNIRFKKFDKSNGLKDLGIYSICEGKNGEIILGNYENGVAIFKDEKFKYYSKMDGLMSNLSQALFSLEKNRVWIGSDIGICEFDYSNLSKVKVNRYPVLNNIIEVNQNSLLLDSNFLWVGTTSGLFRIDIQNLAGKKKIPDLIIQEVKLFYDIIRWEDHSKKINPWTGVGTNPIFDYNQNSLKFVFSATGIIQEYKYQFYLEGLNSDWSEPTFTNEIFYNGLKPGKYVLKVRATDGMGNYSKVLEYPFEIIPAFWQTVWFKIVVGVLVVLVLVLIFRWRTNQLRNRQSQLERTILEKTKEVVHQKDLLEEKQKEVTDSINYAKRIQYSLLAHDELLKSNLNEYFVLFKPKDIVSGDFYWATKKVETGNLKVSNTDAINNLNVQFKSRFYFAICDSTGHGVPGAFMSLLNISYLNEAINEKEISDPAMVFDHVRNSLINKLEGGQDGMDAALISLDFNSSVLEYAAANNSIILIRDGKLGELPKDKMPVGKSDKKESFQKFSLPIQKDDMIYLYTDGYADQFGGEKGKKFKYANLNKLILSIHHLPMHEQKIQLEKEFEKWKGDLEQVDDVCIAGIKT